MADPNGQIGFACVQLVDQSDDMDAEADGPNCECCGWCWMGQIFLRMAWACCCACGDLMTSAKM